MMELVEKLRACFFKVVFVKGTPKATTVPKEKYGIRKRMNSLKFIVFYTKCQKRSFLI